MSESMEQVVDKREAIASLPDLESWKSFARGVGLSDETIAKYEMTGDAVVESWGSVSA